MTSSHEEAIAEEQKTRLDNEIKKIQAHWQVPHVCLFLFMMQRPLRLKKFSIHDFELAIINPDRSKFAQEFMTKLLLYTGEPKSLLTLSKGEGYDFVWWNARLRDRVAGWFTDQKRESKLLQILNREGAEFTEEEDLEETQEFMAQQNRLYDGKIPSEEQLELSLAHWEMILAPFSQTNPLEDCNYTGLSLEMRVLTFKALCDWHFYKADHKCENLRDYTNDDLRVEIYAEDKQYFFYQFPQFWEDCRLYRSSKKTKKWECCCANLDEMEIFAKKLKKTRKNKQFRSDLQHLIAELKEEQERLERDRVKKEKMRELMAQPRRMSSRLEVKLKQQMEQEQTRLEHEKTRRAAQLERARKQAELMAIRKKEQAAQDVQMAAAQKQEDMQRRLYAREEGKRERQAREQRREEMRKIVDAQKRAQLLEQEAEQKKQAEQKRLLREYRLKKRALLIEGGEELANTLKPPAFMVEQMQSKSKKLTAPPKKRQRRRTTTTPLQRCVAVWHKMYQSKFAGAFLEPVNTDFYPTYLDLVTIPMDLGTVGKKLKTGTYLCVDDFVHDMRLVWSNCMTFNQRGSKIFKFALKLSTQFERYLKSWVMTTRASGPWVKELNENSWADELYGAMEQPEADEAPAAARPRIEGPQSPRTQQTLSNTGADPVARMPQPPPTTAVDGSSSHQEPTRRLPSESPLAKTDSGEALSVMAELEAGQESRALAPSESGVSSPDRGDAAQNSGSSKKVITWGDISFPNQNQDLPASATSTLSSTVVASADESSPDSEVVQKNVTQDHPSAGASHTSDLSRSQPATSSSSHSRDFWGSPLVAGLLHNPAALRSETTSSVSSISATADRHSFALASKANTRPNVESRPTSLDDRSPFSSEASSIRGHVSRVSMLDPDTLESLRLLQQREARSMQPVYSSSMLAQLGRSSQAFGGLNSTDSQNDLSGVPRGGSWDAHRASQNPYLGST